MGALIFSCDNFEGVFLSFRVIVVSGNKTHSFGKKEK